MQSWTVPAHGKVWDSGLSPCRGEASSKAQTNIQALLKHQEAFVS